MKKVPEVSFLDMIGPSDIAYIAVVIKNGRDMWDQQLNMTEMSAVAHGVKEARLRPLFTNGKGRKKEKVKSLWNKEGMTYFKWVEEKWKQMYKDETVMKIIYRGWERSWLGKDGAELTVGGNSDKTLKSPIMYLMTMKVVMTVDILRIGEHSNVKSG